MASSKFPRGTQGVRDAARFEAIMAGGWFAGLPVDIQQEMLPHLQFRKLGRGEVLVNQGDPPRGLMGVISGQLRIYGTGSDGTVSLITLMRQGDWHGFHSAIDEMPYAFSAAATRGSELVLLPLQATHTIFMTELERYKLIAGPALIAARVMYHFLVETNGRPPIQLLAQRLLDLSHWAYAPDAEPNAVVEHVNQNDIADACNLARPTVNRVLRELADRGYLKLGYGRIVFTDVDGLRKIAMGDLGSGPINRMSCGGPVAG